MLGAGFVIRPTLDILSDAGIAVSVSMKGFSVYHEALLTLNQLAEVLNLLRGYPKASRMLPPYRLMLRMINL
jgi:hypothetical protein